MTRIWLLWLGLAHADVSVRPSPAPASFGALDVIDHACRLIAAKKYNAKAFETEIGVDSTRKLPEQHIFPGAKDYTRFVPPSAVFNELTVSANWVGKELFNQVTLTVAPKARLTVAELRKLFPSPPRFAMIMDAFDIEDLILRKKVPGSAVECELVVTVPRERKNLDAVTVNEVTLQE